MLFDFLGWLLGDRSSFYRLLHRLAKSKENELKQLKADGLIQDYQKPTVNMDDGRIEYGIMCKKPCESVEVIFTVPKEAAGEKL